MKDIKQILKEVKDKWGIETVQAIIRKMASYPIRDRGTLSRSITYAQDDVEDDIEFFMADYGKFIDEGVGIFGPKKTRIPKESIPGMAYHLKGWASSKNVNPWAVATNIQKRGGIKARPFFKSVIESRVPQLGEMVTQAYNQYLESKIKNIEKGE